MIASKLRTVCCCQLCTLCNTPSQSGVTARFFCLCPKQTLRHHFLLLLTLFTTLSSLTKKKFQVSSLVLHSLHIFKEHNVSVACSIKLSCMLLPDGYLLKIYRNPHQVNNLIKTLSISQHGFPCYARQCTNIQARACWRWWYWKGELYSKFAWAQRDHSVYSKACVEILWRRRDILEILITDDITDYLCQASLDWRV